MLDSALLTAIDWVVAVLTGGAAVIVAIIAVAVVGIMMLAGRLPLQRGATIILGCFIVFSASTIAAALLTQSNDAPPAMTNSAQAPTYRPGIAKPVPFDPYAGASVPSQPSQEQLH